MHVQFMRIWAWMHEFVMLEWVWWEILAFMWYNCEIELHWDVIWDLYKVSIIIFENWDITCMICWLKIKLELKNSIWKTQIFDVRSSGGRAARAGKSCSPHFLQSWMSARAGYPTLERGVFVDRPLARALYSTLERIFHATSTFAGLKGPLERVSWRSSGDPVLWNFVCSFCVSFSVIFHL